MVVEHETFPSGWIGLFVRLSLTEIDVLVDRLTQLKDGNLEHFHFRRNDFASDTGVADVEIALQGEAEKSNLVIE